jgi:hypothetical protein
MKKAKSQTPTIEKLTGPQWETLLNVVANDIFPGNVSIKAHRINGKDRKVVISVYHQWTISETELQNKTPKEKYDYLKSKPIRIRH